MNMGFPGFGGPSGSAPTFSGEWIHTPSGSKVIVRDNFIEGNNMVIRLQDGRIIDMNEFSRDYVQVSDAEYDINGNMISQNNPMQSSPEPSFDYFKGMEPSTPKEDDKNNDEITPDDDCYGKPSYQEKETSQPSRPINNNIPVKSYGLLNKLFDKIEKSPNIAVDINWPELPTNELSMLVNFFDVTKEEIAAYIYDRYFTKDVIIDSINENLVSMIK